MAEKVIEYICNNYEGIDNEWKRFLSSHKNVIIFGAGRQARVVLDLCRMHDKKVVGLMTSGDTNRWGLLPRENEMPLYSFENMTNFPDVETVDVIIGVASKWNNQVTEQLEELGIHNVYAISDWDEQNDIIREQYYINYFRYYGGELLEDASGERFLKMKLNGKEFKTYLPYDEVFASNIYGELGNIVMPALFDDERACCLGPYERGDNIKLKEGNIVFDLGANVGLFSCVAESRGCKTYAFEPGNIPVMKYLKKTAELNTSITVAPYAVGDYDGKAKFYINTHTEIDRELCQSSIHKDLNSAYDEIEVEVICLDTFVEKYNITHVDFIKSHIEYAEDYMLRGAQKLLNRDHPVLSFYSQKAIHPERYKEIERLIKLACSDYKIEYYKRRVYAYV